MENKFKKYNYRGSSYTLTELFAIAQKVGGQKVKTRAALWQRINSLGFTIEEAVHGKRMVDRVCPCGCNRIFRVEYDSDRTLYDPGTCAHACKKLLINYGCIPPEDWVLCKTCEEWFPVFPSTLSNDKSREYCCKECFYKSKGQTVNTGNKEWAELGNPQIDPHENCQKKTMLGIVECSKFNSCTFAKCTGFNPNIEPRIYIKSNFRVPI